MRLGSAWNPQNTVSKEPESVRLERPPLREATKRHACLYLVFANDEVEALGVRRLTDIIHEGVRETCLGR